MKIEEPINVKIDVRVNERKRTQNFRSDLKTGYLTGRSTFRVEKPTFKIFKWMFSNSLNNSLTTNFYRLAIVVFKATVLVLQGHKLIIKSNSISELIKGRFSIGLEGPVDFVTTIVNDLQ